MKKAAVAALAVIAAMPAMAQYGEACGCPPVASRGTPILLSSLATGGNLTNNTTILDCQHNYTLDLLLYVNDGQDLYIQAGTVIKANSGTALNAKSIVVSRGGQIWAEGTESCPIVFTAATDNLNTNLPMGATGQGLWGSLLILGKATNNLLAANGGLAVADGVGTIEGLAAGDVRNQYGKFPNVGGSFNDDDNSGVLRYVSLRHGGTVIGGANEINGLTLGSVGRGTTIDHVEVIANQDDGFEMFGGTANLKYCTAMFCNDDYIDYDQGYSGKIQFFFGVMLPSPGAQGDKAMENDGDDSSSGNSPLSDPTIYNATIICRNATRAIENKEKTRGFIANSVFANATVGCNMSNARAGADAYNEWLANNLEVRNNTYVGVGSLLQVNAAAPTAPDLATFTGQGNILDGTLIDYSFTSDAAGAVFTGAYNPVPAAGAATTTITPPTDGFFTYANYRGAFAPGQPAWTEGWTLASQLGIDNSLIPCPADITGNGFIDINDFLDLNSVFNTSCDH
ncbi:MAG: hypothetical protein WAU70_13735 [Flavobacteriales bacterium]